VIALSIALVGVLMHAQPRTAPQPGLMLLEAPTKPMTLDKGDHSNIDDAKQVVVRTEEEWAKLWNQHAPDHKRPAVDFSRQMVIGAFMGSRPTAGFSIDILSTIQANGVMTVRYREVFPPRGAITAQVITSPFDLVTVPTFAGDVRFEKVDR
jgi:hypothetical protein